MKNVIDLILELADQDIHIYVENEKLIINSPSEVIADSIISKISTFKSELIEYLSQQSPDTNFLPIERAIDQEYYPLSSAQKRLFFLHEFSPESSSYNMLMVNYLDEKIDKKRIAATLQQLILRHESLRTSFEKIDGVPYQKIHADVVFKLDEHSCTQEDFQAYLNLYNHPFSLTQAPLLRSSLVNIKGVGYVWIVLIHHIISDGTSIEVLKDNFMNLYTGKYLPELQLQYKDFSAWQNGKIQRGEFEIQKEYWLSKFSQGIPKLDFPTDSIRPSTFTFEGGNFEFILDKESTIRLLDLGRRNRGTLQMTLLSILNVLLYKYTGQADLIVGCGVAGRRHPDLEGIVGMFVNTLPIRNFLQEDTTFKAFYQEVISNCLAAYENQDIQFEDLVDLLKVERDPSRNPIIDINLVVQNFTKSTADHSKIIKDDFNPDILSLSKYSETSKFDMTWFVKERDDDIVINLEYYSAIYEHSSIARLVNHFKNVLEIVLEDQDILISRIKLMNDTEELELLNNFVNGVKHDYLNGSTLHEIFEKQSAITPDNIAIVDESGSYTYGELNELSNQLANFLTKDIGLRIEARVGVLQTRTKEFIVSVLGILKAGGTYVPLDIEYPEDRILYMLNDAGIEILLTEKNLIEFGNRLQWRSKGLKHLVCMDSDSIYDERGTLRNELMRKDLWDHVGETATDKIAQGGWMSSFTGEYLSEIEMLEYSRNAYLKLKKHLHKDMKVLEIGCSSGLTMFEIAPEVGRYYGTDLSSSILANTNVAIKEKGYTNIILSCMPAHEIDQLVENDFDLVILNSVIQSFDGHNYLRNVLTKVIGKMKETGLLFLGDLMDEDKRETLIQDLIKFKLTNKENGYRTKTDFSSELFVSRDYLNDLLAYNIGIAEISNSDKIHSIANELTSYRYDALLRIDKHLQNNVSGKKKNQYDKNAIKAQVSSLVDLQVKSTNLAYVIYTSGSTGKPKGVMIEHGAIANTVYAQQTIFNVKEGERGLQFASASFDASVWEIFLMIASGGSLYIINDDSKKTPLLLEQYIVENKIDIATIPPAYLNFIQVENIQRLRKLITAGEPAIPDKAVIFSKHGKYYNAYGPTESSICATVYEVDGNENEKRRSVPIGRPIPNMQVYIVDNDIRLMPLGVIGEICIGGPGIALGYLNKSELTEKSFISNPFIEGAKLYRTGDLGRWLEDGNIEFVGRKDDQVKIRGYRIELGEIETIIQSHEEILSTVVIAKAYLDEEKELIAYVVGTKSLNVTDLRFYLSKVLPSYMLPNHFVQLEELPLTPNGKVDRKRLPDPETHEMGTGIEYVAARNEVEEKLILIWKKLLGKEKIGIKDDFFQLGGHSLKATRLVSQIYREFEVKLALKDLFAKSLLEEQAQLIEGTPKTSFIAISPTETRTWYPLSSSQRRLWVLSQFEEANIAYNMPGIHVFEGNLDSASLERSFNKLIERHEILRTVFKEDEQGETRQFIYSEGDIEFRISHQDLRQERQDEIVKRIIREEISKPFDLKSGPLLRACLIRLEDNKWIFVYTMHHIISDGWSMGILITELLLFYNSLIKEEEITLPPLRIQYKDYSEWQQAQLSGEIFKTHKAYWLSQLEGELPVLELSGDKVRPPVKKYAGGVINKKINKKITEGIKTLSQENGGTLFMGLLTSVKALLYRYTSKGDIIIGSPIAGRQHVDLENQIGFYVNTLALRTKFKGSDSFDELFANVKQVTLGAYEHQMYPFDELVEDLNLPRDLSRNPLFNVMVVLQNARINYKNEQQSLNNIKVKAYEMEENFTSKFDLLFNFTESGDELQANIEYNSDIYNKDTVVRLADHLELLLEGMIKNSSSPIVSIEYLSKKEKEQLMVSFNDTSINYHSDKTVINLFEEQVIRTPDNTVLVFEKTQFTYRELNERSNQLARYIREKASVKAGDSVGVLLGRSEWSVISMISIMKLGCVYVPIDTYLPPSRIQYILEESRSIAVIAEEETEELFAYTNRGDSTIIGLNNLPQDLETSNLGINISVQDSSFIIYTSGSTGKPKGVEQTHRTLYNLTMWSINGLGLISGNKHLQFSSFSFDMSLHDVYYILSTGGELHIVSEVTRKDLWELKDYILKNKVSTLSMPYAALKAMFSEISPEEFKGHCLQEIIVAGEQLYISGGLRVFLEGNPWVKIHNLYGPSETHVVTGISYAHEIGKIPEKALIGKPIHNTYIYILDESMNLVPAGIEGEIYIGGFNLAKGYKNNHDLTSERFIKDPFKKGEIIYRSGDIGKWLLNGEIEYIMRGDNQVKINGYRIELGEIEKALQMLPSVDSSVVLAKSYGEGEKELIAYVVSKKVFNSSELKSHLSNVLPSYMHPNHFVQLEELPLTSNGKVDKRRLPDPDEVSLKTGVEYVAPYNEVQEKIVKIWQEVLGQGKEIGIKDNFFELGGNSIKVIRVISKIQKEFDVKIGIQFFFNRPTIESIAESISYILWNRLDIDEEVEEFKI